jgi:pyridoxine 4-dehydrogenase
MDTLVRGVAIGFAVAAPIGPIGLLCIRRTLANGIANGICSGLGAATADALYAYIAGTALTLALRVVTQLALPLHVVGGIALIALGVRAIRDDATANTKPSPTPRDHLVAFGSTLGLTLVNPATILSFAGIVAGVLERSALLSAGGVAMFALGVFLGSTAWWIVLGLLVGRMRAALRPRTMAVIRVASGGLLVAFGVTALASLLGIATPRAAQYTRGMTTGTHSATAAGTLVIGGDLPVHRLGFGAMRITGPGIWGPPPDRHAALAVLRRAVALDVTFIDTADSYGPNVSEELIAEALRPYPAGLVIATKGGFVRTGPNQWVPDGRPEHLRAALEGSLRRLKLERIDLYQFHRPDPKVPYDESVGALAELARAGKIRHLGLSNASLAQIEQARRITPIVSVQNRFNNASGGAADFNGVTDDQTIAVIAYCEQHGLAFIPWGPLAAGKLSSDRIAAVAQAHGATPNQIALAWLLHRSSVMLPIPGTASVAHLEENVAAAQITLSEREFALLSVSESA